MEIEIGWRLFGVFMAFCIALFSYVGAIANKYRGDNDGD
jgi:hypothetical protein